MEIVIIAVIVCLLYRKQAFKNEVMNDLFILLETSVIFKDENTQKNILNEINYVVDDVKNHVPKLFSLSHALIPNHKYATIAVILERGLLTRKEYENEFHLALGKLFMCIPNNIKLSSLDKQIVRNCYQSYMLVSAKNQQENKELPQELDNFNIFS